MAKRLKQHAAFVTEHADKITALRTSYPAAAEARTDADLAAFLMCCDDNVAKAAEKMSVAEASLASYKDVSVKDCAPFYRTPTSARKRPDGACFLLEDGKGGVARDKLGRPVLAVIGMQHGSALEMQRQYIYVTSRVASYALPGLPPGAACVVIDVQPMEKGAPPSFRFPDKDTRTIFDLQERAFPGALFSSTHFCGLPLFVTWAFRLVKPFMRRETYEAMVLKPSFSHLSSHISPENMLPRWGGTFEFDLDDYTDWRAKEEAIDAQSLCARGEGRAFDTKAAAAAQAAALAAAQGEDSGGSGGGGSGGSGVVTAPEMIAAGSVARKGVVSKRGSGKGLFSTVRWKSKLLVLNPQALCYFDGTDEADGGNKLGRMMPLDPSATVEKLESTSVDSRGPSHQFIVHVGARDYMFGVETSADAEAWISAIQTAISTPPEEAMRIKQGGGEHADADLAVDVAAVSIRPEASGGTAPGTGGKAVTLTPSQVEVL